MISLRNKAAMGLVSIIVLVVFSTSLSARSFRDMLQIPTPSALPSGAKQVEQIQWLDRELVLEGINHILDSWNNGQLENVLAEDFVNARKLIDTVTTTVPQDAELSLLAMRSYNVLRQYRINDPGQSETRVSRVAVTVRLQLTFNDPQTGYQRLSNTSEFIIEIREPF